MHEKCPGVRSYGLGLSRRALLAGPGGKPTMDLRKLKKLIDLVQESGVAELEVKEGEESVRITRTVGAQQTVYLPQPGMPMPPPQTQPQLAPPPPSEEPP